MNTYKLSETLAGPGEISIKRRLFRDFRPVSIQVFVTSFINS